MDAIMERTEAKEATPSTNGDPRVPPPPASLEEAGLSEELVAGLILKALYGRGSALGFELLDMLALPMSLLDDVLQQLQEQRLVEVHATKGPQRGEYVFKLTSAGRSRATEELEICRYVGPAPVPFEDFQRWVALQAVEQMRITASDLQTMLDGIVLPDDTLKLLGPAINSGSSLFLHGGPGNGKTLLAERIARVFGERYFVPYSVLLDGTLMIVHDPVVHAFEPRTHKAVQGRGHGGAEPKSVNGGEGGNGTSEALRREIFRAMPSHDRRYAEARRPVVVTGGELTLEQLDLQWDPAGHMYQAPPQVKAAGGVLVIDDLGRQRVPVRDLLNRWVVPLEHGQDYLTTRSGRKIIVPFDCFVIFSTNLEPHSLADEAFLRRIHYKIEVPDPDRAEYERIFRACCEERDIPFDAAAIEYLYDEFYSDGTIQPRRCHPRDVLDHLEDIAGFLGEPARLSPELIRPACQSYFLSAAKARPHENGSPTAGRTLDFHAGCGEPAS